MNKVDVDVHSFSAAVICPISFVPGLTCLFLHLWIFALTVECILLVNFDQKLAIKGGKYMECDEDYNE